MRSCRAVAVALICGCLLSPSPTRAQSALIIRPALLPLPHVINEGADPSQFKPTPTDVVLHQFFLLPGWMKERNFQDLCEWLTEQGIVIVRANGPKPWGDYPSIKFRTNVGNFNRAFHVTVMEKPRWPWWYSVFTDPVMPSRFASKNAKYIEGYTLGPDEFGVGASCR